MALIAGSITTTIRDAQGFGGHYPSPFMMHGYLTSSGANLMRYFTGGGLFDVSGRLSVVAGGTDGVGATAAANTHAGILGAMAPRRQAIEPLTSANAPLGAVPNQYSTPADPSVFIIGERGTFEEDFGVEYMASMPGNLFMGHIATGDAAGGGVDLAAAITLLNAVGTTTLCRVTALGAAGAAEDSIMEMTGLALADGIPKGMFSTGAQLGAGEGSHRITGFRNPQPLSWLTSTTFINSPGPCVISGATAAINPVIIAAPFISMWM